MVEIPRCKDCGHQPNIHDNGPNHRNCSATKTDARTDAKSTCLCELFVPPEDWLYSPAADAPCKKRDDGGNHLTRIKDTRIDGNTYTAIAHCQYCDMVFALCKKIKPPYSKPEYK